jgi:hypothetical protein
MKSISQLVRLVSQSDSSQDTGSERENQNLNMNEDTSTQFGTSGVNPSNTRLNPLEQRIQLVAQTALNKLFTKDHFDICTLRNVIEAIGKGNKSHPSYKQLQALHCVDYAEMPKALRDQIPMMVNEVFTDSPVIQATQDALKGVF